MDDSQDKVRRNLVVVAAAIILIQYLQVQITPETKLGVFTISKIPQLQFWLLALVVLAYLFQRYWFDETARKEKESALREFYGLRNVRILARLRSEIHRHITGSEVLRLVKGISNVVNEYHSAHYSPDTFDHVHIGLTTDGSNQWKLAGRVEVEITRTKNGHAISSVRSNKEPTYRLSKWDVIRVSAVPILRTGLFSKAAVDFLVPLYLTVGALGICLYRLSRAFIGS